MTATRHLIAAGTAGRALTPEQRRFNQLLAKIEKARRDLEAWNEQSRLFAEVHAERVAPLDAELLRCQAVLIRRLDALFGERAAKWTAGDRRRLRSDLSDLIAGLISNVDDEALIGEMKALFEKHAGHDYETENREAVAAMKQMFEAASGVDLGDEVFDSEEDLLLHARRRFAAAADAEGPDEAMAAPARRQPNAAQRKREREQAEASQSLREVYRKLAAALHPDRAADDADRRRRDALMPRVNQAYEARDLLALLSLQLEIEQVDPAHLARVTAERVKAYNRLLGEQLREIEAEIEARRMGLCFEYDLDPHRPPRLETLGRVLEERVRERRAELAAAAHDLRQLDDPARARAFMRNRWRELEREMPF